MAAKLIATLTDPLPLKHVVDTMKDLVKNVNMDCNEHGIQVQCTDTANVGLVHLDMRAKIFDSFECTKPLTFGMNMEYLAKVLKLCGNTDKLTLEVDTESTGLVNWTFEGTEDGQKTKSHTAMPTMDLDQDALGIPESDYEVELTMSSLSLKKAIADCKDSGEALILTATKEGLQFSVEGEMGTGSIYLQKTEDVDGTKMDNALNAEEEGEMLKILKFENNVTLRFAMRYMSLFTKDNFLGKECAICMKNDEPITLQYDLGDDKENGFLRFLLAPKQDD